MVDYTKKEMRDESWRRWKGGAKLAKELRVFYTTKKALDRVAFHNPGWTDKPAANGETKQKAARWSARRRMDFHEIGKQKRVLQQVYGTPAAAAPAAPLPGKDSPTR